MKNKLVMAITTLLCLDIMSCGLLWPSYTYPSVTRFRPTKICPESKFDPCKDKTIKIGDQVWQKCNLNVNPGTGRSACYDNKPENCAIYGRLYDWATAMNLPSNCNDSICASKVSAKHRGLCPSGWHIPNDADWDKLVNYTGDRGKHLKAKEKCWGGFDADDSYGFSARPGGRGEFFKGLNEDGYWWSASESGNSHGYDANTHANNRKVWSGVGFFFELSDKYSLYSVRCLKD